MAKYHGLGNDFLILDGMGADPCLSEPAVRALCDRRRGVGADGLIVARAGRPGADLTMVLHNADGGRAEMSGNGIRCLAWFAVHNGLVSGPEVRIATDAGVRATRVEPTSRRGLALVGVDMGRVAVAPGDEDVAADGRRWRGRLVDVGNPHLVLVEDHLAGLPLETLGPLVAVRAPGGVNVEWMASHPGDGSVALRVWERGVGQTLACGTGSVAAAAAAIAMGLVPGPTVAVHNPGGVLEVDCAGDGAVLRGPAQRIATMVVDVPPP